MKLLLLAVLCLAGCSRTVETCTNTEVYPHDPQTIHKVYMSVTFKTQW